MKIYHTETQADYDALMVELEEQGCKWLSGRKPTDTKGWVSRKENTCIRVSQGRLTREGIEFFENHLPHIPITKYKEKAEEKMRFTKENVLNLTDKWFENKTVSFQDLQNQIKELDDTPEKVVVPKFVAEWIQRNKEAGVSLQTMIKCYNNLYYNNLYKNSDLDLRESDSEKTVQWYVDNPYKFIQAYEDGYTIEPDTVTEQRYTVVIADRYLVQLFIGRTDFRFVDFDEMCAWKPIAYQLTESEIKAIDERYWAFAVPAQEKTNEL